jgi:iron complex transport system substrate-binding protein
VFFEVRPEPLTAAGRGSIVQQNITAAGAENTVKSEKAIVHYSFEALLVTDPDVYIVQRGPMSRNPVAPKNRPHFDQLRSVRKGKVIYVDEYLFSRPGPRCVEAVEQLARELYPDRFR